MSSVEPDLNSLSDKQLLQDLLLGKSGFQPAIFLLYVEEAKKRNFDSASYTTDSPSMVDFLSAVDISRKTPFDSGSTTKHEAFPGVVSRSKRVTGFLIAAIGGFFLFAFFSWITNPIWPFLIFGTIIAIGGVARFHAGRPIGYFLDAEGVCELTKGSIRGAQIFSWVEVTRVELAEVPRRKTIFSVFSHPFVRFAQDIAFGKTESRIVFVLDDGREIAVWANSLYDFELFVISVRRMRNLTSSST